MNQTGAAAEITRNPHNQTLGFAIQWGLIGVLALYAMWLSHIALFWNANWDQLGRISDCRSEHRQLVVQLPPVRFPGGMDLRARRRRRRRHGAAESTHQSITAPAMTVCASRRKP
ncbi:MAG: hypothetical protein H0V72_11010 [Bradyrhizobium sp.]|nr:hypothetical protein [Bradyrhizobium sp.]